MHEFMHALGFHHEQSRTDRDEYVFVNYTNIQPGKTNSLRRTYRNYYRWCFYFKRNKLGKEGNFRTYDQDTIQYLGADYDYSKPTGIAFWWSIKLLNYSCGSIEKESILHYGKYGFAIDPTIPTITPIPDASVEIGQREGFSEVSN